MLLSHFSCFQLILMLEQCTVANQCNTDVILSSLQAASKKLCKHVILSMHISRYSVLVSFKLASWINVHNLCHVNISQVCGIEYISGWLIRSNSWGHRGSHNTSICYTTYPTQVHGELGEQGRGNLEPGANPQTDTPFTDNVEFLINLQHMLEFGEKTGVAGGSPWSVRRICKLNIHIMEAGIKPTPEVWGKHTNY